MKYKEYSETVPLARELYNTLFPKPKTHREWAESFNQIGRINRILIKHK